MINFKSITLEEKKLYESYLSDGKERGCEYSFTNLFLWGRQKGTVLHNHIVLFSQFNRRSVYPFPVGSGDKKQVLDAIIADSKERGIPCRITGVLQEEREILETLYPDMFRFHCDRGGFDYIYDINDLADLKGRKYQSKRNHFNRFCENNPDYKVEPVSETNIEKVKEMVDLWYKNKLKENPDNDFIMEQAAISKMFKNYQELDMDGLIILNGEEVLGMTMGSRLSDDTFDVQFEKARGDIQGAYTAINKEFATYLREKYPFIKYLNREEDLGIEGLRKAKEGYHPHHMVEKCWACLLEENNDY